MRLVSFTSILKGKLLVVPLCLNLGLLKKSDPNETVCTENPAAFIDQRKYNCSLKLTNLKTDTIVMKQEHQSLASSGSETTTEGKREVREICNIGLLYINKQSALIYINLRVRAICFKLLLHSQCVTVLDGDLAWNM